MKKNITARFCRSFEIIGYAKLSKCEFGLKQVAFLGRVILMGGISVDPSKMQDVLSWNMHVSVSEIHNFVGFAGYHWRFIEGFLNITRPMTKLVGKDKMFKWMPACEASFQELMKQLTTAMMLVIPDMKKTFLISCDALGQGLGCVLICKMVTW
jgi:hypothetical protein